MSIINVITLSEPSCVCDGAETTLPVQKRRFALLAYLAMERSAPRARIVALFYPEIDESRAGRRLTQSIYSIRQVFGSNCIETRGGEVRACESLISDAGDFGTLADRGEYELALALYRRPFLDGFYLSKACDWERWVERRRAVLARTFSHAARLWIGKLIEQANYVAAITQASRWLELDEDNQEAHRLFMTALARSGRGEDALCHYQNWERSLLEHQGDVPCEPMTAFIDNLRKNLGPAPVKPAEPEVHRPGKNGVLPMALVPESSRVSRDGAPAPPAAEAPGRIRSMIQRALKHRIAAL
ncbi:MAG: AfsR/SARP family transcriptional regulator [Longimicrobiales bacterium]